MRLPIPRRPSMADVVQRNSRRTGRRHRSSYGGEVRYAKRTDANQSGIVSALRAIGVGVYVASSAGNGLADLVCAYRGILYLLEVKDGSKPPSARKLTVEQVRLHDMLRQHGVKVHVVTSEDDALAVFWARTMG